MAIDSEQKRKSAVDVTLPWRGSGDVPDGTVDRAAAAGMYASDELSAGSNVSLLDPSLLKPGLVDGANLKPSLVTTSYAGGTPSAASELKPGLVGADGNLKPSLVNADGSLKSGLLRT